MKYIIIILLLASSYLFYKAYNDALSNKIEFDMGKLKIIRQDGTEINMEAKFADTINERAQGLMNVKTLGENEAMLFIFEQEEARKMWMENTYVPLDMLFVNGKREIFNFKENAQPLSREIIYSAGPALYVVEVQGGFVKKNNINIGDRIEYELK